MQVGQCTRLSLCMYVGFLLTTLGASTTTSSPPLPPLNYQGKSGISIGCWVFYFIFLPFTGSLGFHTRPTRKPPPPPPLRSFQGRVYIIIGRFHFLRFAKPFWKKSFSFLISSYVGKNLPPYRSLPSHNTTYSFPPVRKDELRRLTIARGRG